MTSSLLHLLSPLSSEFYFHFWIRKNVLIEESLRDLGLIKGKYRATKGSKTQHILLGSTWTGL